MLRLAIVAFAAGCALLQTQARLPALEGAWGLPLALVLLGSWRAPGVPLRRLGWLALALLAGFYYAAWRAEVRMQEVLPSLWEGRSLTLVGRVTGLPEASPRGVNFVLAVAPGSGVVPEGAAHFPRRLRLGWYPPGQTATHTVAAGACIQVTARLHRPHGPANPGGFDYQAWLLERGIRAVGTVADGPRPAQGCGNGALALLDQTRARVRAHLAQSLAGLPYGGVVIALAVGDQNAIPASQWTLFRQTGTSHLFSVSGLHITLFSTLVFALTRWLWRRLPRLALAMPAQRAGLVLGLVAATAYTLLSGLGIPAQRTLFMLLGAGAAAWAGMGTSPSRLLAAALAAVVLLDPWAALAPGFWLSFGAVAALLWAGMGAPGQAPLWRTWARAQWAVTIGLLPLLLALFHEVSLVSPLANALAIPAISLLAVPLALLAAVWPWDLLAQLAHGVVWGVMVFLHALAALPQPVWHGAAPGPAALILALLGAGVLLLPRGFPARWLGWVLCLPLFFPRLPAPGPGEAWMTVLDVGQGAAILVRTTNHTLLVDGGPRYLSGEDAGTRIVAPYLWSQGINRLDGLVLTHDDLDHSGGVGALLESHRPGWLLTSLAGVAPQTLGAAGQAILTARPDARACAAGQTWTWDGVVFRVLHPPAHHYALAGYGDNDRGCVLTLQTPAQAGDKPRQPGTRALLAADIQHLSEANLLERAMPVGADVLVVPHHGSKTSSTVPFLAAVSPRLALIPVGHRNRYGHPHPAVLAEYRRRGIAVLRTDRHGALQVELGGEPLRVTTWRGTVQRYWHDPAF